MKKLLVIQLDGTYFVEETFRVLEKFHPALKDFELTVLVTSGALREVSSIRAPMVPGITSDVDAVLRGTYDVSANLSMDEGSWDLHGRVTSGRKLGPYLDQGRLLVPDLWSTFLLTVKANAPFLTFHLQDIYRNILGLKKVTWPEPSSGTLKEIVLGNFSETFLTLDEREKFTVSLRAQAPHLKVRNSIEVDLISDLSHTLYLGPATLDSLRLGEAGARGIYLSRNFQGFNLLPNEGYHHVITTRGRPLQARDLNTIVQSTIAGKLQAPQDCCLYEVDHENLFGAYLRALGSSDPVYPVYQSHVVLWNFLLNLFEVNLEVVKCTVEQLELVRECQNVLAKLLRLQDYALKSVDIVYHEAKSSSSNGDTIEGHLKNLREIDEVLSKVSASQSLLRPFLDFYRIRRAQNEGSSLLEQIHHSFLTYSEEHHALTALSELFSVTLRKNEASI